MPVLQMWFYNAGPDASDQQTSADINAMLDAGADVLGLCEVGGDGPLPDRGSHAKYRDRSNRSRANVAAYVHRDLIDPERDVEWWQLTETWGRTKTDGIHEARAWLKLPTRFQLIVGHQPPKFTDNVLPSQREGIELLVERMLPWNRPSWDTLDADARRLAKDRPRVVMADWNRQPNETGPGPATLADALDGSVIGSHIDGAVLRGDCAVWEFGYRGRVSGVDLHTDHPWGAFHFDLSMDQRWIG
jgi:hypothetical protein